MKSARESQSFAKANVLNELFTDVTKINDDSIDFPRLTPITDARLDTIQLTTLHVKDAIHDTSSNKSPGPDGIHLPSSTFQLL